MANLYFRGIPASHAHKTQSNDLYDAKNFTGLRLRLETEGYIFVRGVIPQEVALRARKGMLTQANEDGSIDTSKGPFGEGRIMRKVQLVRMDGSKEYSFSSFVLMIGIEMDGGLLRGRRDGR